ncbi:DAK2 domain-containing protein [Paenibacillus sp.]|uniref:DAK2 domain-containing protein n=1 Tax=Paenibacillus sp. TaxID=58172 RepID=UPI0028112D04|nr:DAK2 domain-containing protein [Paenibacillus sp.]
MSKRFIDGAEFTSMALAAAERLHANVQRVNALNVFPVPDGDTGTNMNLTLTSGVDELKKRTSPHLGRSAEVMAKGLLMGARGNSGVILSQLFRGFSKSVASFEKADAAQFALALQQGVETAYAAVVRPVEGTILTVSKEAAKAAIQSARRGGDVVAVMRDTLDAAKHALARTPDLLPVLKQVGVVDSGGQGLVFVYEGFYAVLSGEVPAATIVEPVAAAGPKTDYSVIPPESIEQARRAAEKHAPVQAHIETESIEHGYCTEFIVRLTPGGKMPGVVFEEPGFREKLEGMGDSLLVVADDDLVKIHIHAEHPGEVMTYAQQFGDLTRIKIENMREQHSHILSQDYETDVITDVDPAMAAVEPPRKPFAMIAVAAGEGLSDVFASLGVDFVLSGGQTMNPSTEDILKAIDSVPSDRVFVLPNNSNIVMAANQAKEIAEKQVIVVPTKTIQQGIAAVLAYQEGGDFERNGEAMSSAAKRVKSGQVTFAVRDTSIDGVDIKEGDHIGILDGKIVVSNDDPYETCTELLRSMLSDGEEIVSVYVGESADDAVTDRLRGFFEEQYPDVEVELLPGGQPVYAYLFSAE